MSNPADIKEIDVPKLDWSIALGISGCIGVGKSTLLGALERALRKRGIECETLPEWFSEELLGLSIQDPGHWASHFQTSMVSLALARKVITSHMARKSKSPMVICTERPVEENRIFALTKFQELEGSDITVNSLDTEYIEKFYDPLVAYYDRVSKQEMSKGLCESKPVNVLLWCDLKNLVKRIDDRSRECEKLMADSYMQTLYVNYFIWAIVNYSPKRLFVVDWNPYLGDEDSREEKAYELFQKICGFAARSGAPLSASLVPVRFNFRKFLALPFSEKEKEMSRVLNALMDNVGTSLVIEGGIPNVYSKILKFEK